MQKNRMPKYKSYHDLRHKLLSTCISILLFFYYYLGRKIITGPFCYSFFKLNEVFLEEIRVRKLLF
jgi:hypothetical protein